MKLNEQISERRDEGTPELVVAGCGTILLLGLLWAAVAPKTKNVRLDSGDTARVKVYNNGQTYVECDNLLRSGGKYSSSYKLGDLESDGVPDYRFGLHGIPTKDEISDRDKSIFAEAVGKFREGK